MPADDLAGVTVTSSHRHRYPRAPYERSINEQDHPGDRLPTNLGDDQMCGKLAREATQEQRRKTRRAVPMERRRKDPVERGDGRVVSAFAQLQSGSKPPPRSVAAGRAETVGPQPFGVAVLNVNPHHDGRTLWARCS